jgi:hypothetical protein
MRIFRTLFCIFALLLLIEHAKRVGFDTSLLARDYLAAIKAFPTGKIKKMIKERL